MFALLATANAAGYRYGASDLAFYGPAVMRHVDGSLFPRDRDLIDAQARLTLMDETVGTIARVTTDNFPILFLALYLLTLLLLVCGAVAVGNAMYVHRWSTVALVLALTLRHAIARSGTNSLEPYFHPRQLAFAFGVLAIAAFIRGRVPLVVPALAGAALLHPTTTLWFVVWLGVAAFAAYPHWRARLAVAGAAAFAIALWLVSSGSGGSPGGRLGLMDPEWLGAIEEKEYLFPLRWPVSAWLLNLGYVAVIVLVYRWRTATGRRLRHEGALVAGCLALVPLFFCAVALNAAHVALAIQLQPARVFWMLDFLATVYLVWIIADSATEPGRRPAWAAVAILALSAARGAYVMKVEFPERPLFEVRVPGDWGAVMDWARRTDRGSAWLAHPDHAARYGTSVRMAAARDVFVEGTKDSAVGMYDRRIALRTRDRLRALEELGDFDTLPPDAVRRLADTHALDYLVTEQLLPFTQAFQSGAIRVYELSRARGPGAPPEAPRR